MLLSTLQKSLFEVFAFDLYDVDKSGAIDIAEAQQLIMDVYGSKFETDVHARR
jgi:Ca2+-binding EF-hand superfamily protein